MGSAQWTGSAVGAFAASKNSSKVGGGNNNENDPAIFMIVLIVITAIIIGLAFLLGDNSPINQKPKTEIKNAK